jgi:hypothetical protein
MIETDNVAARKQSLALNVHQLRRADVIAIGRRIGARIAARREGLDRIFSRLAALAQ